MNTELNRENTKECKVGYKIRQGQEGSNIKKINLETSLFLSPSSPPFPYARIQINNLKIFLVIKSKKH